MDTTSTTYSFSLHSELDTQLVFPSIATADDMIILLSEIDNTHGTYNNEKLCYILDSLVKLCEGKPLNVQYFGEHDVFWVQFNYILENLLIIDKVVFYCFKAIMYLCRHGLLRETENVNNVVKLGVIGACEIIMKVIRKFKTNVPILEVGFMAMHNLSANDDNRVILGVSGACEFVVECIQTHANSASVVEAATKLVHNLAANNNHANKVKLGNAGVCELLVTVIKHHFDHPGVVESGGRAIGYLLYNNNQNHKRFLSIPEVYQLLTTALQMHQTHAVVVESICNTMCSFTYIDDASKVLLGSMGACELIVQSLCQHRCEAKVQESGFRALCNLANNSINKYKLGTADVCDASIQSIKLHTKQKELVKVACNFLRNLLTGEDQECVRNNGASLCYIGACEVIVRQLSVAADPHGDQHEVHEMLCSLLKLLVGKTPYKERVAAAGFDTKWTIEDRV